MWKISKQIWMKSKENRLNGCTIDASEATTLGPRNSQFSKRASKYQKKYFRWKLIVCVGVCIMRIVEASLHESKSSIVSTLILSNTPVSYLKFALFRWHFDKKFHLDIKVLSKRILKKRTKAFNQHFHLTSTTFIYNLWPFPPTFAQIMLVYT